MIERATSGCPVIDRYYESGKYSDAMLHNNVQYSLVNVPIGYILRK